YSGRTGVGLSVGSDADKNTGEGATHLCQGKGWGRENRGLCGPCIAALAQPQLANAPLAQSLTELLQSRAKEVVPPRYKLVCHVVLGQQGQQSLVVASRGLWDPDTDSFASATFSNASLFAVATVHGVYFE
uniref:Uncharacterized protein n=1 Tax=Corvus moneduloides TaxID=1196302 RepID=A0A8U7MKF7_CORMO